MKSPAAAMTWELLARDRWGLLATFLGTLAIPLFLFATLRHEGGLRPGDESTGALYLALFETSIFCFGGALLSKQWTLAAWYTRPMSTAALVGWRLGPSMAMIAAQTAAWTLTINWLFGLSWPVGGPAAYAAVTLATAAAAVWICGPSRWCIFALTVVLTLTGFWLKSRFGPMFADPQYFWSAVTVGEGVTMLVTGALAFWVAVIGAARGRRGEPAFSLGFVARLARLFDRPARRGVAYRSAAHAQLWYVWRNGWALPLVMPLIMLTMGGVAFAVWALTGESASVLLEVVLAGRGVIIVMALVTGVVMGEISSGKIVTMSQFLATRSISSTAIARSSLVGGAVSLAALWVVWAVAMGVVMLIVWLMQPAGSDTAPLLPGVLAWQEIPGAIVASWIALALGTLMLLSGRGALVIKVVLVACGAWVAFAILAKLALTPEIQAMCERAFAIGFGVTCALGTAWALAAARRRRLIEGSTAAAGVALWLALEIAAVLLVPVQAPATAYVLLCGVLSLAVFPLGAAPLVVAWNRAR